MNWHADDARFMRAALAEAATAASVGEVPVGAIVVRHGQIVARGLNRSIQDHDPTAHAEIVAMREAASEARNYRLNDASLYVTMEPCVMCMGAMLHARIARVVFGAYDRKAGAAGSVIDLAAERQFNHRMEVNGGLLEEQSAALLTSFFAKRR